MFVYSKLSSRKIAHSQHCRFIIGKNKDRLGFFHTSEEAIAAGYRLCKCCTHAAKLFGKYRSRALRYCKEKDYKISFLNDVIDIETPFSKWKIVLSKNGDAFVLYHRNSIYVWTNEKERFKGYHYQNVTNHDLIMLLDYISRHDSYRKVNPFQCSLFLPEKKKPASGRKSKRKKGRIKKEQKRKKKKKMVNMVYKILDRLE